MSGIEVVGVVAAVIQIADVGARLSTKLHSFGLRVKNAEKTLAEVSNNVALTCNILRELGENLKADQRSKLCSPSAIDTAWNVADECKKVFLELDEELDEVVPQNSDDGVSDAVTKGGRKWADRIVGRVKFTLREPQIEVLQSNLEKVKSSMLLMLNVMIYGEQIRRESRPVLRDQQEFVQLLLQQEEENKARLAELKLALAAGATGDQSIKSSTDPFNPFQVNIAHISKHDQWSTARGNQSTSESTGGPGDELRYYHGLIRSLLTEINAVQHQLVNPWRRHRIREGLLKMHEGEIERFRATHNANEISALFASPLFSSQQTFTSQDHHQSNATFDDFKTLSSEEGGASSIHWSESQRYHSSSSGVEPVKVERSDAEFAAFPKSHTQTTQFMEPFSRQQAEGQPMAHGAPSLPASSRSEQKIIKFSAPEALEDSSSEGEGFVMDLVGGSSDWLAGHRTQVHVTPSLEGTQPYSVPIITKHRDNSGEAQMSSPFVEQATNVAHDTTGYREDARVSYEPYGGRHELYAPMAPAPDTRRGGSGDSDAGSRTAADVPGNLSQVRLLVSTWTTLSREEVLSSV